MPVSDVVAVATVLLSGRSGGCDTWPIITVMHDPPGASRWDLIDHRMFCLISENWAGESLVSYEAMRKFLRGTRSATGFLLGAA